MLKSHWKRWIVVPAALAIVVALVGGCQSDEPADDSQPTEVEESKPTLKFSDTQYETVWLGNALAEFILGNGYGYPVEHVQLSVQVSQVALASGDIDVWLDNWWWYWLDWWDTVIADGEIEDLGISMEPAPSFWVIPQWVHDEHGIDSVFDLADNWELFQDPEDSSKGLFINCPIGWQCQQINRIKLEAYGLSDYYNISESTAGALDAALAGAQLKREPIVGYYWAPTALMGMYDWYVLEEPEYSDAVWDMILKAVDDDDLRPLDEACAYEAVSPRNIVWAGLREKAPDAVAMLDKMNIGLEQTNRASAWVKDNEVEDWEKAAVWYMREYESRWKGWITAEAFTKVKAALDAYEAVP